MLIIFLAGFSIIFEMEIARFFRFFETQSICYELIEFQ